ncbi:metal-dependent hydrolase [Actinomadura parmotrematis]|uniref:Metal-dependent hydrolase n=1 Tax=Actinomadura parmotrematis TaxID=2864039 RepID=A0ABS7G2K5_9ACTN|nr:metal-dependent hydrolase [Actinomadura parmotrematis]MBW8486949.1 metal-dependent hydrolase [Actinomadura parmotrematis]
MSSPAARTRPAVAVRPRRVRTRRVSFSYPPGTLRRHYAGGDLMMSHIVAVLSALFPEGEDFFVRTVRAYRDEITDPELQRQVAGFIGQEVTHGREHRHLNDRLADLGYPTRFVDRRTKYGLAFAHRVLPKDFQLAVTAALEHYTATLAEVLLLDPEARAIIDSPEVRRLLLWHALEESEHKSVAFDVFMTVSGNERVRVWAMRYATFGLLAGTFTGVLASLAKDRAAYDLRALTASLRKLPSSPWLKPDAIARIRAYTRPGFHPDDFDNTALIDRWKADLFDETETGDAAAPPTAAP